MATYEELRSLFNDATLKNKIAVAVIVAANTIQNELATVTNHANRLIWAKKAYQQPEVINDEMLKAVLAANKSMTLAQINGASDAAIQTNVDAAVDLFADGS